MDKYEYGYNSNEEEFLIGKIVIKLSAIVNSEKHNSSDQIKYWLVCSPKNLNCFCLSKGSFVDTEIRKGI